MVYEPAVLVDGIITPPDVMLNPEGDEVYVPPAGPVSVGETVPALLWQSVGKGYEMVADVTDVTVMTSEEDVPFPQRLPGVTVSVPPTAAKPKFNVFNGKV